MIKIIVLTILITLGALFSLGVSVGKITFEEKCWYFLGLIIGAAIGCSIFTLSHI